MKRLDIRSLLSDHNVPFATSGSKHTMPGWVNVNCPFCPGSKDYHLGFNEAREFWNCWRCGWHPQEATVAALTGTTASEARALVESYRTGRPVALAPPSPAPPKIEKVALPGLPLVPAIKGPIIGPTMARQGPKRPLILTQASQAGQRQGPPLARALTYLARRGFCEGGDRNLEWLVEAYNLHATGPIGPYAFRVIAPIYFDGNLVSYQGRDYTGKSELPYKACPKELEVREHKHCLYAMDLAVGETVVVVEGVVDAWKLGPGAVATFGSSFTWPQVRLLGERWSRHVVLYDPDAENKANELANALSGISKRVVVARLGRWKDPGAMDVSAAKALMEDLLKL